LTILVFIKTGAKGSSCCLAAVVHAVFGIGCDY